MSHKPSRIQLLSACLGNLFEHYDTALFGLLSSFLAPLIFPQHEPITALIMTYAMIPLGMIARPFGSLVFGYIGDTYGRQRALFWTLFGMAVISLVIAFSPTYLQAGALAPVIFCLGRFLQNFLSSGETMGGAIFLLENTPEKRHDILSSLYNASTIGGFLLASAGVSLLCHFKCIESGWRLLYVFGAITALFGCFIRRGIPVSEARTNPIKFSESTLELSKDLWRYRGPLFLIAVSAGFAYANYAIALVLMNGFIPLVSSLTKAEMISLNSALLVFDFCALPFFGWLASKISREKLMLSASLAVVIGGIPLFMMLEGSNFWGVIGIRICFVILGVAFFAPFHAWAQELIPSAQRYAVISFGYALGSQLLGGPTAAISLWLFKKTNHVASVSLYWLVLALFSSLAISYAYIMKKRSFRKEMA